MKAKQFKQDSGSTHRDPVYNSYVAEALAKQAASRPPKAPAKIMPVTPHLKKVPKLYRKRRAK